MRYPKYLYFMLQTLQNMCDRRIKKFPIYPQMYLEYLPGCLVLLTTNKTLKKTDK